MMTLVLGLVVFFAVHLVSTNTNLRDGLIARFGEVGFKLGFSIVSLLGFAVIIIGYHKMQMPEFVGSKNPILWFPPVELRSVAIGMMFPAIVLLVAAYVPSRIRFIVGHPMLLAIKVWALAHLLTNGTVADVLLFGSFLVFAIYDRISLKRRGVGPRPGDAQAGIANDIGVVVAGAAIYALLLFWGHEFMVGKSLIM